jgi:ribosome assembly protein YihI (activator of Der GTPase)
MKTKNPLYVVKGKEVQEASSVIDLVIKRFNLEPMINILKNIFYLLLEQVENFAMYKAVKAYVDEMMQKITDLGQKLGIKNFGA